MFRPRIVSGRGLLPEDGRAILLNNRIATDEGLGVGDEVTLTVNGTSYDYFSLKAAEEAGVGNLSRLPFSLKALLENLLRYEDGRTVTVSVKTMGETCNNLVPTSDKVEVGEFVTKEVKTGNNTIVSIIPDVG